MSRVHTSTKCHTHNTDGGSKARVQSLAEAGAGRWDTVAGRARRRRPRWPASGASVQPPSGASALCSRSSRCGVRGGGGRARRRAQAAAPRLASEGPPHPRRRRRRTYRSFRRLSVQTHRPQQQQQPGRQRVRHSQRAHWRSCTQRGPAAPAPGTDSARVLLECRSLPPPSGLPEYNLLHSLPRRTGCSLRKSAPVLVRCSFLANRMAHESIELVNRCPVRTHIDS